METTTKKTNAEAELLNSVTLNGEICSEKEFSHEVYGEQFYTLKLSVKRLSEKTDEILLTISERLTNLDELTVGTKVSILGQFRSYNKHEENKNHLILSVFVRELVIINEEPEENKNSITLNGYICKAPVYRKTPLGREIADVLLAVNRPYGKSDYIPCICWGRNARYVSGLEVGQGVTINGRVQSRVYTKKIGEEVEERTAYEVSVSKIELFN